MSSSPFPGMDPYLEAPDVWASLHSRLMNTIADLLTPQIVPKYIADIETQIVIDSIDDDTNGGVGSNKLTALPDVTVIKSGGGAGGMIATEEMVATPLRLRLPMPVERRLTTVRIVKRAGEKLVTAIELLSPVNKRAGAKRRQYLKKRARYIESNVHLVEIDLFRNWQRMPLEGNVPTCDYLILVSDANERPDVMAWPLTVRQELPTIPIPLLRPDPPVNLDLGEALRIVYAHARYDLRIDYHQPANPPLTPADAAWAAALIASQS